MSYWYYVESDPCERCGSDGSELFSRNYTWNVLGATYEAGLDFKEWNGKTGEEFAPALRKAIETIASDIGGYKGRHNPDNGWGEVGSFLELLRALLACLEQHPKARFRLS